MSVIPTSNIRITRSELVNILLQRPEKSFESKSIRLTEYLLEKTGCPTEKVADIKHTLSNFLAGFKKRYSTVHQRRDRFETKYNQWLQQTETFPVYTCVAKSAGRPSLPFDESSDRSKRWKTETLRQSTSTSELCYAASMNLRSSGQPKAADIVRQISVSPEKNNFSISQKPIEPHQSLLSPEEALAFFINGRFSVSQYKLIRKTDPVRFPSYNSVHQIKKTCISPEEFINITEKCATVKLQALLDHTADKILQLQKEVLSSIKLDYSASVDLKLIVKWGCDGASGMSEYKQSFVDSSAVSDASIFFTSMVPLRLMFGDIILWNNLKPSSSRFCRPIKMELTHETTSSTQAEIVRVNNEIKNLLPFKNLSPPFNVTYDLLFTMIDNKICNAATETSSSQRCYLCNATSKQFNCLNAMIRREITTSHTKFGLSTLHCWIRLFECMLHISYNLPFEKWQATTPEYKTIKQQRKQHIQAQFYDRLGLIVDRPKQNYGSSNDGNTARRFFQNLEVSSDITGINKNLIKRLYYILITISCGYDINLELYKSYCLKTAVVYLKLYQWYYMPTSLHKLLIHSNEIISNFAIPIGALSEEAQECRNRDIKHYRQSFSRKCSRKATMTDVFNRLLISSDPLLSSLQELPKPKLKSIPNDVVKMLKAPEAPKLSSSFINNQNVPSIKQR